MLKRVIHAITFATTLVLLSHTPAHAQAARTWVASNGNDNAVCSRGAPCRTFAGAIAKTAAGGAITCVDAAEYGALNIAKSISIVCDHTLAAITSIAGTGVNITTAATDAVTLSGLDIEGAGTGITGINFTGGGSLHVHKVRVRGFRGTTSNRALGINFVPTAAAKLFVSDCVISGNGFGFGGAGILVAPSAAGASAAIVNCRVENNTLGIRTIGSPTTSNVVISDSTFVGNSSGILNSGSTVMVSRVVSANNSNQGILNGNTGATVRVGDSVVSGNVTGISNGSGSFLTTYKNNQIRGNTTDGTPLPTETAE
jgi:hypothetical protein